MRQRLVIGMMVMVLAVLGGAGCSTLRMGRLASYQALPMPPQEFAALTVYTLVVLPKPTVLHFSEQGHAWRLLVSRVDGSVEQTVAVTFDPPFRPSPDSCHGTPQLLAILAGGLATYVGARGVLLSHDGQRCFGADGEQHSCAQRDLWEHVPVLDRVMVMNRATSPFDPMLRRWYEKLHLVPMVASENSTLSPQEWDRIAGEESVWRDVLDVSPPALGAGLASGILSQAVLPALLVGGVVLLVRLPFLLFAPSTGPEYGDRPMRADEVAVLAEHLLQCSQVPKWRKRITPSPEASTSTRTATVAR